MKIYLVGGAVRDRLLGLPVRERDWVVTGATETMMLEKGFKPLDSRFPVFSHPQTGEEYALARTETKQSSGYKGFSVYAGTDVTLEQDLLRRDLTINAIAEDEDGHLIDPLGGQEDLRQGRLRHVSGHFIEDPVRLLRIARFASVLGEYGFHVVHPTFKLMKQMAVPDELSALRAERVWAEMQKSLQSSQPWQFFKLLGKCGALEQLLPEFNQWINNPVMQHGQDSVSIQALKQVVAQTQDTTVRLAVLMFRAVYEGHLRPEKHLPLDRNTKQLLQLLERVAGLFLQAETALDWYKLVESAGGMRRQSRVDDLLLCLRAVFPEQDQRHAVFADVCQQTRQIETKELRKQGFDGKQLGEQLRKQRMEVIQRCLDNPGICS